jgi:hypothetical protein
MTFENSNKTAGKKGDTPGLLRRLRKTGQSPAVLFEFLSPFIERSRGEVVSRRHFLWCRTLRATIFAAAAFAALSSRSTAEISPKNDKSDSSEQSSPAASPIDERFDSQKLTFADERQRVEYESALQQLLLVQEPNLLRSRTAAKEAYERAKNLCRDDPRLPYAYGLVLSHHSEPRKSLAMLDEAANSKSHFYTPAWRAGIYTRLKSQNSYAAAMKRLIDLSSRIELAQAASDKPVDHAPLCQWMGMAAGFLLNAAPLTPDVQVEMKKGTEQILASLQPADQQHFNAGIEQVRKKFESQKGHADAKEKALEQKKMSKKKASRNRLLQLREKSVADRSEASASIELEKRKMEKVNVDTDRRLQELKKEHDEVSALLVEAKKELAREETLGRGIVFSEAGKSDAQRAVEELQQEVDRIEAEASELDADRSMQEQEFLSETDALARKSAERKSEEEKLKKVLKRNQKLAPKQKSPLRRRSESIATYLPFDVKQEKLRLLAEIEGRSDATGPVDTKAK